MDQISKQYDEVKNECAKLSVRLDETQTKKVDEGKVDNCDEMNAEGCQDPNDEVFSCDEEDDDDVELVTLGDGTEKKTELPSLNYPTAGISEEFKELVQENLDSNKFTLPDMLSSLIKQQRTVVDITKGMFFDSQDEELSVVLGFINTRINPFIVPRGAFKIGSRSVLTVKRSLLPRFLYRINNLKISLLHLIEMKEILCKPPKSKVEYLYQAYINPVKMHLKQVERGVRELRRQLLPSDIASHIKGQIVNNPILKGKIWNITDSNFTDIAKAYKNRYNGGRSRFFPKNQGQRYMQNRPFRGGRFQNQGKDRPNDKFGSKSQSGRYTKSKRTQNK